MGKKFGWSATVHNHRTGETTQAHGVTSSDNPGYGASDAERDVRNALHTEGRKNGEQLTATDVQLYG